jgi:anti-sigma factor RsiW
MDSGRLSDVEDLSCRELVELVTDYFDGALAPSERARFEAHVAGCAGCERYLAQMRTTIALAGESRAIEDRPDVTGLLAAFRDWKR